MDVNTEITEIKDRLQDHLDDDVMMKKMEHKYGLEEKGEHMNQDIAGLMALAKDGDNGMNSWFGPIIALGALRLFMNPTDSATAQQSDIFASTTAINNNIDDARLGISGDIIAQAQNTNGIISTGFQAMGNRQDQIVNTVRTVGDVLGNGIATVNGNISEANYANLIQFKDLDNKLCGMEARLAAQATENQYMTNQNFKDLELRDCQQALNEAQRERDLYMTGNFPVTTPAHLDKWNGNNSGVDIDQNAINIAIGNGIAQGIAQLAPVLATK